MSTTEHLGTYLNDHLGGAVGGTELAAKLAADNEGTPLGQFLADLHRDIGVDLKTLERLMQALDVQKNPMKQATGWLLEKVSRLKLNERVTGGADFLIMLQIEALATGIDGKCAMWLALRELGDADGHYGGMDMNELVERAKSQRAGLEEHRLAAAARAFAAPPA